MNNRYVYNADHGIVETSGSIYASSIEKAIECIALRYVNTQHNSVYISIRNLSDIEDFKNRVKIK